MFEVFLEGATSQERPYTMTPSTPQKNSSYWKTTIKNEIIDPEYIGVEVSHMNIFGKYYLS